MSEPSTLATRTGTPEDPRANTDHWPRIREIIMLALEDYPEARTTLAEALQKAIEPEPCPTCGRK